MCVCVSLWIWRKCQAAVIRDDDRLNLHGPVTVDDQACLNCRHLFALDCKSVCQRCAAKLSPVITGWQQTQRSDRAMEAVTQSPTASSWNAASQGASMKGSEGIAVEHPSWKYDCGVTGRWWEEEEEEECERVKGLIESDGKSWRERLGVRRVLTWKEFSFYFLLNVFIVWAALSISEMGREILRAADLLWGLQVGLHTLVVEVELISISLLIRIEMQLYYQAVKGWSEAGRPAVID